MARLQEFRPGTRLVRVVDGRVFVVFARGCRTYELYTAAQTVPRLYTVTTIHVPIAVVHGPGWKEEGADDR